MTRAGSPAKYVYLWHTNTAMKPLIPTFGKLKLPIEPTWNHVEHHKKVCYKDDPVLLNIIHVLIFSLYRRFLSDIPLGNDAERLCESVLFGVNAKIRERRFKRVVTILGITATICFTIIVTLLASNLIPFLAVVIPAIIFGVIVVHGTNSLKDYLFWNKSSCLREQHSVDQEDSIFLDLPYIHLIATIVVDQLKSEPLKPSFSHFKNGNVGIDEDLRIISQLMLNHMIGLAEEIEHSREINTDHTQKDGTLGSLVSISVHLGLFGSNRMDSLPTKKDLCKGILNRAFIALGAKSKEVYVDSVPTG